MSDILVRSRTKAHDKPSLTAGVPLGDLCFIETQFPVSKMSIESYTERKANNGQTLTGLGKWWGRKPLVLCRAAILGLLLPTTDDPQRDREIFLRLMTMDDDGMLRRKSVSIPAKELFKRLPRADRSRYFESDSNDEKAKLIGGLSQNEKKELQTRVFLSLSYDERLTYCDRPEQVDGPSRESWAAINEHLGTNASTLPELTAELGNRRFGQIPRVGDSFCGGGSIPFEAARLGCTAFASDLNPVATLMTWGALNIVGGAPRIMKEVQKAQREVFALVDGQVTEWAIEHNALGWRADAYLYCAEVRDPESESAWSVPLAPSWVIGEKTRTIAKLVPDEKNKRYEIEIISGATVDEMRQAKASGTVVDFRLVPPNGGPSSPIESLSRHLRMWERDDICPRPDDVFLDRLFCVRWVEIYYEHDLGQKVVELTKAVAEALSDFDELLKRGKLKRKRRRHYRGVTQCDLEREQKVLDLIRDRLVSWQRQGYVPSRSIERGKDINRPTNARGWTHWHHFFNPRQLLINGLFAECASQLPLSPSQQAGCLLGVGRIADWNSRESRWDSSAANEKGTQTFYKPSLATPVFNYCCRTASSLDTTFLGNLPSYTAQGSQHLALMDARLIRTICDIWITDPPYADAVNYHELSEYFLAWYEKRLPQVFADWYADSKRALAIKADNPQAFRQSMAACYGRLVQYMPENGLQIVMFTHHDASVWADLSMILWAAGLRVTAAWCIATETDSTLKQGNYVQGTVLLVLRKQTNTESAFLDEVYQDVEAEVRRQLDSMRHLDDAKDPNFSDTDYQLAAYAAALRVLTAKRIEEIDVAYELIRSRKKGEKSPVEDLIERAVKIACDHLVPRGIDSHLWKTLTAGERLYVKGLEVESHGEYRAGVYQELARGFGVGEYKPLMASTKANETRLKTASEFGNREINDAGFGGSLVRQTLFAVCKTSETENPRDGINWLTTEVKDYAASRPRVIEILDFLAALRMNASLPHWHKDAEAAGLLAGALRNRQDNV